MHLTDMERRVLDFLNLVEPGISGPEGFIEGARPAFHRLVERGLIERIYVLSESGKAAVSAGQRGES